MHGKNSCPVILMDEFDCVNCACKLSEKFRFIRMIEKRYDSPHHVEHDNSISPQLQKKFNYNVAPL